ncbi:dentin sialophosphoprotein-like [Cydia pomonella]|uniref:dentin sialophosphoprotein-like n=1 Tax=Cydia pomonella TaxID=82600 RepID=UPI002ADD532C|nr:dentin sialophosphoprotein-like [Cydia pomonella]
MAQAEDTELRDLVLEALEKNGSLAKIRALLRANIFLAFEDDCENMKQNVNLDNILKIPEGVLALSIVHEFLEFCNLKNTLFVYMSESRQGTEYMYEGRNILVDRLQFLNGNHDSKEPVLVTFVKNILRPHQKKYYEQGDAGNAGQHDSLTAKQRKDDQNCTYIVHEDSSMSTSNSTSDNSSDEKNKLHLKLPLDNSDTDTSSDSVRDKMSSEYIPNQHILSQARSNVDRLTLDQHLSQHNDTPPTNLQNREIKPNINNSSESTSYVDIKSLKPPDEANITIPVIAVDNVNNSPVSCQKPTHTSSQPENMKANSESPSSATMNSISSLSLKHENGKKLQKSTLLTTDDPTKSENEVTEYSLDFSLSQVSRNKSIPESQLQLPDQIKDQTSPLLSPHQNSQSSQSSVSISDVADLIEYSDRSYLFEHNQNKDKETEVTPSKASNKSKNAESDQNLVPSEDSGDFSESPIPSLSNLSLDVHSD